MGFIVKRITREGLISLDHLAVEAESEGFQFVRKTLTEWESGKNRFDRSGEILFGVYEGKNLIGIGGLNRDPYTDAPSVGRVRHLYVHPVCRRKGIGKMLLEHIIQAAGRRFSRLRLYTENPEAMKLYEHMGCIPCSEENVSHILDIL